MSAPQIPRRQRIVEVKGRFHAADDTFGHRRHHAKCAPATELKAVRADQGRHQQGRQRCEHCQRVKRDVCRHLCSADELVVYR